MDARKRGFEEVEEEEEEERGEVASDDDDNSGIVSGQGATPIAGRVLISSQSWPASRC